ncbi:MAG: hypothetical protein ACREU7_14210 [Burkholderiales bacterium]
MCRVLYIVSPPYVFLETDGKLVYDDAIVLGNDWETLAKQQWQSHALENPDRVCAKRQNAIKELARRKGMADQV